MSALTCSPSAGATPGGPSSLPNRGNERAPDFAWTNADLAGLPSGVQLWRLDRPRGPVRVVGADGLTIVVRVNLLARAPAPGVGGATQLKQCLAPDYYIVLPPKKAASIAAHDGQALLRIELTFDALVVLGHMEPPHRLAGKVVADGVVTGLVERLFVDYQGDTLPSYKMQLLKTILLSVAATESNLGVVRASGGLTSRQLATLKAHVENRLQQRLRNSELARLVALSPFHFARAFKQSMGVAPATWIKLRRLTVAQQLLANAGLSITDVAAAVGYESPSRFARAFRLVTGQSPSAFRRVLRTQQE